MSRYWSMAWVFGMVILASPGYSATYTEATSIPASSEESLLEELKRGFYSRIYLLAFGIAQDPKESNLNPDNILALTRYQAVLNPRVDLNLDFRQLELGVKPRYLLDWQRWEDGQRSGDESTSQYVYVNEWFARYRLADQFLVSYGQENLQWGPSVILSSSNPFNRENGRNNTRIEVPGLQYARAVWIPDAAWTVSFIANTGAGRLNSAQGFGLNQSAFLNKAEQKSIFEPAYALKIDYTGEGTYMPPLSHPTANTRVINWVISAAGMSPTRYSFTVKATSPSTTISRCRPVLHILWN